MIRKLILVVTVCIGLIIFGITLRPAESYLQINGREFSFQVADNTQKRAQGLSGLSGLGDDEALVFVFPESAKHGIWMKDMNFDIDIIWLDRDKKVVDFEINVSPDTYPEVFYPESDAIFVIEVNAGTVEDLNLQDGQYVEFTLP